jgi:polysaccharide export outer membrane protein
VQVFFKPGLIEVRKRVILLAAATLMLSGCAETWESNPPGAAPGGMGLARDGAIVEGPDAVASVRMLPAHNARGPLPPYGSRGEAAAYEYGHGYNVGSGDRLTIKVAGEAELSGDYLVDGSGNISMPYVQNLPVAGKTTAEIEHLIVMRLKNGFLRDPKVSVQATTLRPFFILGEVTTAGSFGYQPGMTVQNAVAIAGGYSARADQGEVLLTRRTADGTATYKVPVTTQLYPGDIVYVRERWF